MAGPRSLPGDGYVQIRWLCLRRGGMSRGMGTPHR